MTTTNLPAKLPPAQLKSLINIPETFLISLHSVKLGTICQSYSKLCKYLNIPIQAGLSKQRQLDYLSNFLEITELKASSFGKGSTFIIIGIFPEAFNIETIYTKAQRDTQPCFWVDQLAPFLLHKLANQCLESDSRFTYKQLIFRSSTLMTELGFVPSNFNLLKSKSVKDFLSIEEFADLSSEDIIIAKPNLSKTKKSEEELNQFLAIITSPSTIRTPIPQAIHKLLLTDKTILKIIQNVYFSYFNDKIKKVLLTLQRKLIIDYEYSYCSIDFSSNLNLITKEENSTIILLTQDTLKEFKFDSEREAYKSSLSSQFYTKRNTLVKEKLNLTPVKAHITGFSPGRLAHAETFIKTKDYLEPVLFDLTTKANTQFKQSFLTKHKNYDEKMLIALLDKILPNTTKDYLIEKVNSSLITDEPFLIQVNRALT